MKPFRSISAITDTVLVAVYFCHAADAVQQFISLSNKAYKKSILQKIESLIAGWTPTVRDNFTAEGASITFTRDGNGKIDGFDLESGR